MSVIASDPAIPKESGEAFTVAVVASDVLERMVGDSLVIGTVELDRIMAEDGEDESLAVTLVRTNTEVFEEPGETHAIGHLIFFWLTGGLRGQTYRIFFTIETTDGQTITAIVPVEMVG